MCNVHFILGSGKTLCYLIPIINKLWKEEITPNTSLLESKIKFARRYQRHGKGVHRFSPDAIVFLPTRELTLQVADMVRDLADGSGRVYGVY